MSSCPNCGNSAEGADIYQCADCNKICCQECFATTLFMKECPSCGGFLGYLRTN